MPLPKSLLKEIEAPRLVDEEAAAKMPPPKKIEVPEGFLDGPAPNLQHYKVDFKKEGLPEYEGLWAVVLDGVMTEEECDKVVELAEATTNATWERAMVNIGGGFQALYEDTRKCGRIIWDSQELAARLWKRIDQAVPEIHRLEKWASVTGNGPWKRNEVWRVTRLNERLRFLKYTGGEYFKAHCDGTYETPDRTERSYFTLHLYLNDADGREGQPPLKGGATTFHAYGMDRRIDVVPKVGRVLLFQHRSLIHSGDDVISGTKLTMRTDIMYAKEFEDGDTKGSDGLPMEHPTPNKLPSAADVRRKREQDLSEASYAAEYARLEAQSAKSEREL